MEQHPGDEGFQTNGERGGEGVSDPMPSDGSRWLGALSYLFVLVLFVLYETRHRPRDEFVRFHARQGFALFFVELVCVALSWVLGATLGEIPVLGAILMLLFRLAVGVLAIGLSAWGFIEALGGQRWQIPILGEYAQRVPVGGAAGNQPSQG